MAAAALGLPDVGILSMRDQINAVQSIANAVEIPVMADGDTGFGNALNTYHTDAQAFVQRHAVLHVLQPQRIAAGVEREAAIMAS